MYFMAYRISLILEQVFYGDNLYEKIEKTYFIVPLLIYLFSPLKNIVYERIFIISPFGMFVLALKINNDEI